MAFPFDVDVSRLLSAYVSVPLAPIDNTFDGGFMVRIEGQHAGSIQSPIHTSEPANQILAFSSICPHMGCRLEANPLAVERCPDTAALKQLVCGPCACHGTTFDLVREGLVVLGPATQNLAQLKLQLSGDGTGVIATGWQQSPEPASANWPARSGSQ